MKDDVKPTHKCVICKKEDADNCMDTQVREDGSVAGIHFHTECLQ